MSTGRKWYEEIEPKHGIARGMAGEVDQADQASCAAARAVAMDALNRESDGADGESARSAGDEIVAPFWDAIAPEEAALKTAVGASLVKMLLDKGDHSEALAKQIGEGMFGKRVKGKEKRNENTIFSLIADGLSLGK